VVVRAQLAGRAERLVAMAMVWNGLVITPIYALGFTKLLYRGVLAGVSGVFFALVIALAYRGRPRAEMTRAIRVALLEVLALPRDAVRECLRKGSLLVAGGVFFAIALSIWTAITSWYVSSWGQWDALWYHEPMIGWAIQNHGFDVVNLPTSAQKTNGYPRLVEMTQLWFVIFTDRRLIELANSIFGPVLAVATYALCRRYTKDKVAAMGWGAALLLSPVVSNLFQTIYVDVHYAAFVVAATWFATRAEFRIRDALLTSVCLALAIGSKSMALVPVPVIGFIALARLVRLHWRPRRRAMLAAAAAGLAMIGALASATYVKNYFAFHNPLWPDVKVDIEALGIHWPGYAPMYGKGGQKIDMNLPFETLVGDLYAIPYSKSGSFYYQSFDYGFTLAYVIVPLSSFAFVAAAYVLARDGVRKLRKRESQREPRASIALAWDSMVVGVVGLSMILTTPALWGARYNIAPMAIMMVACAWLGGRRGFTRLGHGAATVAVVGACIMCSWVQPRWYWYPHELVKLAKIRYPEREVTPASIAPGLWLTRGSSVTKEVGLARERELGPGKIILFDEDYGNYPAHFWNNTFSNKAIYVPRDQLLAEAERLGATWIFLSNGDPLHRQVRAPGSGWQEVGVINVESWGHVFRRAR